MERGQVFNIQRYSLHDGPGIRTTVFLKGCPLSCNWCHNPESRAREPEVRYLETRCVQCGQCVEVCPQGPDWSPADGVRPDCLRCGACVDVCPVGARQMIGREMTVAEVVQEAMRDRLFHEQSGGGVTLSGGEPLSQPEFVKALLHAFRAEEAHVALDTCGFVPPGILRAIAPLVDLFLYDIKCMDEATHRRETGVPNHLILENLETLGAIHGNIWVRIPLIPGVNLNSGQLEATARFVSPLTGVRQVNLLPYHALGTGKTGRPTDRSQRPGELSLSEEQIDRAAQVFRAAGLHTLVGG